MNATRLAIVIAPLATRKPPTPSTTRNETCIAIPAIGTTRDEIFATRMPASHAPSALRSTAAISRSVAFAARMVRTALIARSTAAAEVADLLLLIAAGDPHSTREQNHADDGDRDHEHGEPEQHGVDDRHADDRADEHTIPPPRASTSPCVMTA